MNEIILFKTDSILNVILENSRNLQRLLTNVTDN